jgi:hypothetical protein
MSLALSRYATCRRTAARRVPALHSVVQRARRQRAACAALPLSFGQRCAPGARLAAGRSRERMRKAEMEGQIKGVARCAHPSQSARGFAAAPHLVLWVPRSTCIQHDSGVCRVPFAMRCATVRWSFHGCK